MLYLADFTLQKQPEHSLMVAISRAWYNGSYTMATKPIKSLEMHYTMIQFLIITISLMRLQTYKSWGPVVRKPITHPRMKQVNRGSSRWLKMFLKAAF